MAYPPIIVISIIVIVIISVVSAVRRLTAMADNIITVVADDGVYSDDGDDVISHCC